MRPASRSAKSQRSIRIGMLLLSVWNPIVTWLIRRGVRVGSLIVLTTAGRRSGVSRSVPLRAFRDKAGLPLVVAAALGTEASPAWFLNLTARKGKALMVSSGKQLGVEPEVLDGAEHELYWPDIIKQAPRYARFQARTERRFAIVRLRPHE